MRLLLTGFEPFGGQKLNSSWEAVRRVEPGRLQDVELERLQLPVVFGRSVEVLAEAVGRFRPDVILAVGQADTRMAISVERVAINVEDAREPDNSGQQPVDRAVVAAGPAAYFATLPLRAMLAALKAAELPAEISNSAGTYVCNHLFYGARHLAETGNPAMRVGFVHVPLTPGQPGAAPGLDAERVATGLEAMVGAITRSRAVA